MNTSLLKIYAVIISAPHNVYSVCINVQNCMHVHACVCVHAGVHIYSSTVTFSFLAKN